MPSQRVTVFTTLLVILVSVIPTTLGLGMEITPSKYTEENKDSVQIACYTDDSDQCDKIHVMVLKLGHQGQKPMAVVRSLSGLSRGPTMPKSYQVEGDIAGGQGGSTFINITIPTPRNHDTGSFVCSMFYFDVLGELTEESVTADLSVEVLDLHSVVKTLMNEVSDLKGQLRDQASKDVAVSASLENSTQELILALEDKFKNDMETLDNRTDILENRAGSLENMTQRMKMETGTQLADINDRISYRSDFVAAFKQDTWVDSGDIVFNNVVTNIGQGYNPSTGAFTAPRRGLYVFNLVMCSWYSCGSSCSGYNELKVNGAAIAALRTEEDSTKRHDQSSVSQVVELTRGDTVKVVATYKMRWGSYPHSYFSGYLIMAY